jgi:hypothetical protein
VKLDLHSMDCLRFTRRDGKEIKPKLAGHSK